MTYLIANWKSHFSNTQSLIWLKKVEEILPPIPVSLKIVICLPFTDLPEFNRHINFSKTPFFIGSQTVSQYPAGKHTGDITAQMLSELVTYSLVGHSERRVQHKETSQDVAKQASRLVLQNITPIICLDRPYLEEQIKELFLLNIPLSKCLFAYEPSSAIGGRQAELPEDAAKVAAKINLLANEKVPVLYGGSVSPQNILSFTNQPSIKGVLVGGNSLDPNIFNQLIRLLSNET